MRVLTPVLIASLLWACATMPQSKTVAAVPTSGAQEPKIETRTLASFGPCPVGASSITAMLLSALVSFAVDRVGKALRTAASEQTFKRTANRYVDLKGMTPGKSKPLCMTVARGQFFTEFPDEDRSLSDYAREYLDETSGRFNYESMAQAPSALAGENLANWFKSGLTLAAAPEFLLTAEVTCVATETGTSAGKCAYATLDPRLAYLGKAIGQSRYKKGLEREVLVAMALSPLGEPADLNEGGGVVLQVGTLEAGTLKRWSAPTSQTSNRGFPDVEICTDQNEPFFLLDEQAPGQAGQSCVDIKIGSPDKYGVFALPVTGQFETRRLQVMVSETRGKNAFLSFVADVFDAAKSGIKTEIQTALIPEMRLAAEEKKLNAYEDAIAKAGAALMACSAANSTTAQLAAARVTVRKLNEAARALGINDPVGAIPGDQAGCGTANGTVNGLLN